ncbi:hypothetical protein ACOZ4L_00835 [Haloplanus ruber]|uniref:Tetrapyrrole biosynthesis glutamyl-tRNA reductase dimerisation domain-containing protein n=1 Tax=Haloplanus ruber TaxID=869892 RepID=A0ABD6CYV3_9EURY|nr:hypothetical protein [Haloplanus ruber]
MSTPPICQATARPEDRSITAEASDDAPADAAALDRRLRERGVAVADRELATALGRLDDLSPAQRQVVATMAGRIAAGVLAPARAAVDCEGGDRVDGSVSPETVRRLFLPDEDVRDGA